MTEVRGLRTPKVMKYSKYILIGIVFIFFISLFLFIRGYEFTINTAYGDYDGDGVDEKVVLKGSLFSEYGKNIVIYKGSGAAFDNTEPKNTKKNSSKYMEIYREDFSELKPWRVDSGDIDGNGIEEISIGVYKEAIFHPVMAKRPFIYSFDGVRLVPKWRGSRLSRPFTEYTFYDIDQDGIDELLAIEELVDGKNIIHSYKWRYFGFEGYLESAVFDSLSNLESSQELTIWIENGNKHRISLKESRLILERID